MPLQGYTIIVAQVDDFVNRHFRPLELYCHLVNAVLAGIFGVVVDNFLVFFD